jgi:hypothetical protein
MHRSGDHALFQGDEVRMSCFSCRIRTVTGKGVLDSMAPTMSAKLALEAWAGVAKAATYLSS